MPSWKTILLLSAHFLSIHLNGFERRKIQKITKLQHSKRSAPRRITPQFLSPEANLVLAKSVLCQHKTASARCGQKLFEKKVGRLETSIQCMDSVLNYCNIWLTGLEKMGSHPQRALRYDLQKSTLKPTVEKIIMTWHSSWGVSTLVCVHEGSLIQRLSERDIKHLDYSGTVRQKPRSSKINSPKKTNK